MKQKKRVLAFTLSLVLLCVTALADVSGTISTTAKAAEQEEVVASVALATDREVHAEIGETAEIGVSSKVFQIGGGVVPCETTYQWYKFELGAGYQKIDGATEASFSITITSQANWGSYYCKVTNQLEEESDYYFQDTDNEKISVAEIYFGITPKTGVLSLETSDTNYLTNPKDQEELHMEGKASSTRGEITYQWFKVINDENVSISGATEDTLDYVYDADENVTQFYCRVSDGIEVQVVNYIIQYKTETPYVIKSLGTTYRSVNEGDTEILKVSTKINDTDYTASYQWYKGQMEEENKIDGETKDTLKLVKLQSEDAGKYLCEVTIKKKDEEVDHQVFTYSISIFGSVTGSPNAALYVVNEAGEEVDAFMEGEEAHFTVEFRNGTNPQYQWLLYPNNGMYDNNGNPIPTLLEETGKELVLKDLNPDQSGQMVVNVTYTDSNGNEQMITASTGFVVSDDYGIDILDTGHTAKQASLGDSVSLSVAANCVNGELHYQWYQVFEDYSIVEIQGATSSVYTIDEVTEDTFHCGYYCAVSNGNQSVNSGYYTIYEKSPIVSYVGYKPFAVGIGESLQINVNDIVPDAKAITGSDVYYRVQKYDRDSYRYVTMLDTKSANILFSNVTKEDYGVYIITKHNESYSAEYYVCLRPDDYLTFADQEERDHVTTLDGYVMSSAEEEGCLVPNNLYSKLTKYSTSNPKIRDFVSGTPADEYVEDEKAYRVRRESFAVVFGSKVTMDATAVSSIGNEPTYQWKKVEDDGTISNITGATKPVLTVLPNEDDLAPGVRYVCVVRTDLSTAIYEAEVLAMSRNQSVTIQGDEPGTQYVKPGDTVKLEATCAFPDTPDVTWNIQTSKTRRILDSQSLSCEYQVDEKDFIQVAPGVQIAMVKVTCQDTRNNSASAKIMLAILDSDACLQEDLPAFDVSDLLFQYEDVEGDADIEKVIGTLFETYQVAGAESLQITFDKDVSILIKNEVLKELNVQLSLDVLNSKGEVVCSFGENGEDVAGKTIELDGDSATFAVRFAGMTRENYSEQSSSLIPTNIGSYAYLYYYMMNELHAGYRVSEIKEKEAGVESSEEPTAVPDVVPTAIPSGVPAVETPVPTDANEETSGTVESAAPTESETPGESAAPGESVTPVTSPTPVGSETPGESAVPSASANASVTPAAPSGTTSPATYDASVEAVETTMWVGDGKYKVIGEGTVGLIGVKGKLKKFSVPASIQYNQKNYNVVSIEKKAFKNQKKLKSVVIGSKVKSIKKKAFVKCKKLKKITIRSKVLVSVGKKAFAGAAKKLKIKVPGSKKKAYKKMLKKSKLPKKTKIK